MLFSLNSFHLRSRADCLRLQSCEWKMLRQPAGLLGRNTRVGRAMKEKRLPAEILAKGSLRGGEYAWRAKDIPAVIAAAREAGLVNIGGQLQFRGPEFTCECYWVEVDTYKSVPSDLPFNVRVDRTAEAASRVFETLSREVDLLAEGRSAFPNVLESYDDEALRDLMWFVWYVSSGEG
jgi:hypothetical protein